MYSKIKKVYTVDTNNALLVLADLEEGILAAFEQTLNDYTNIFTVFNYQKYKELVKEEENKKKKKDNKDNKDNKESSNKDKENKQDKEEKEKIITNLKN
jgi:hypothetical protein